MASCPLIMSPPVGLQHRSAAAPADRPSVDRGVVVDEQYVLLALVCPHELDRLAVNECLCQLGQICSVYAQYKVCISSTMRTQKPPHKASCTELHRLHRLHRQACCSSAPWRSLLSTLPSAMVTLLHMRRAGGTALHHLDVCGHAGSHAVHMHMQHATCSAVHICTFMCMLRPSRAPAAIK